MTAGVRIAKIRRYRDIADSGGRQGLGGAHVQPFRIPDFVAHREEVTMYHCQIQFYLAGCRSGVLEALEKMPPLENFSHLFSSSGEPDRALAARADLILADVSGRDVEETVQALLADKREGAELILLAGREQMAALAGSFPEISDIWPAPLSETELGFRFLRWQRACKLSKDYWQLNQYLETTINSVPNLVWYKTKDGIHEKVNDSFCKTVNKTKDQVQGRGHAYIWDVEFDDPACIESERIVMETGKTCVAEETVQTGDGTRLLTTYKSPLYNVDGVVMGTVGVAIDITQERSYEQEIINKNRELETLFTTMDCGVMCHTIDGKRILSINRAALKILGYESTEDMVADGFDMVVSSVADEDRERLNACIARLSKVGDNVNIEYQVRHRDGETLHVMGNVKLMEENGELFYQLSLIHI